MKWDGEGTLHSTEWMNAHSYSNPWSSGSTGFHSFPCRLDASTKVLTSMEWMCMHSHSSLQSGCVWIVTVLNRVKVHAESNYSMEWVCVQNHIA